MKYEPYYHACRYLESLGKLDSPLEYMKERGSEDLQRYLLRMQDLLNRVGNPEKNMKFIHITGTSGKGTTVSLLHRALQQAGYTVGSTLSPATTTTLERIKINDNYIDPDIFSDIVNELKPVIEDMYLHGEYGKPSYFDLILAIALIYFQRNNCDWVVLEVGMGGRYDSTNVIPAPVVSAITNIGMDHMHLLGNSKEAIAYEKAGIIKSGSHFFTTETEPKLLALLQKECDDHHVPFHHIEYQSNPNQDLVLAICHYLNIHESHVFSAWDKFQLPCRFEKVSETPDVILDGAHNVDKMRYTLAKLDGHHYHNIHALFGAGNTKDALGMLDILLPRVSTLSLCPLTNGMGDSFSVKKMYEHVKKHYPKTPVHVFLNPSDALDDMIHRAKSNDTLFVTGSLYLTGEIRKQWYSEEYILQNRRSF